MNTERAEQLLQSPPEEVELGGITSVLISQFGDKWTTNDQDNWVNGYGRGPLGAFRHLEAFKEMLERNKTEEGFGLLGVYYQGAPVGYATLTYLGDNTQTTKVFIYIAPEHRQKGVGASALLSLLKNVFRGHVHRVEVDLLSINRDAISFFRNLGFTQEGIKRQAYWMGINSFNVTLLRMLKPEWKRLINGVCS